MVKYYCDRCGEECHKVALTNVRIPIEKTGFGSFSTSEVEVCPSCKKEYDKIIESLIDIRFEIFDKFFSARSDQK